MRSFFRYVLLGLVLVLVALGSGLTAMRVAIHGREVMVPKFVGLTPPQAEKLATENGLLVEFESRFYSTDIPIGHILSQEPFAGEKVRRGWRVRLAESLGPQHVDIPDVVGQSNRAAEINLRRRGLEPGTIAAAHIPGHAEDVVIAQAPPPAAKNVASPKVNLLFAAPAEPQAFVMPNLVGRHLSEATRAILDAGLKVGNVRTADAPQSPSGGASVVSKQSPTAGQKVLAGSSVELEVVR